LIELWRISRHRDLAGIGGMRASGRWHYAGQPIVYLSESPSAALLEVCVHTAANDVPPEFTLLRITGPDLKTSVIDLKELPSGWQTQPETTRDLGTQWLRAKTTALLRVPSAIVPRSSNFLLNPLHRDAKKLRIAETLVYPFDGRIKR
jgi:RES domain-containing protein